MAKHLALGYQLADLLTKPLGKMRVDFICDKLGMYDICSSLKGSIERDIVYWYIEFSPTLPMRLRVLCVCIRV